MKLKQLMAGATIAGALGAAALGVGAGAASAAPGPQPGGHGAPAVSHAGPAPQEPGGGGGHGPGGPGGPGGPAGPGPGGPGDHGPAGPVDRADQAITDPADPVDRATTDPAGPVDQVTTDPADPADRVDRAITDPADRVARIPRTRWTGRSRERGTAMTTAATSTALRGETDPHPGVLASRRDRHGTGRFRRPVDRGTTGRSTTGATRKRLSGTRSSTSSASTSSEFGSRCKDSPHQTPASPIGGAGVAHLPVVAPIRPVTVCQQHGAAWATMRESPKSCQSRALLWGNGDVALDAISARLDRWSG